MLNLNLDEIQILIDSMESLDVTIFTPARFLEISAVRAKLYLERDRAIAQADYDCGFRDEKTLRNMGLNANEVR